MYNKFADVSLPSNWTDPVKEEDPNVALIAVFIFAILVVAVNIVFALIILIKKFLNKNNKNNKDNKSKT